MLQRSGLKTLNKHGALQNLSTYYIQKTIRQQHKNNKLKVISSMWNDEFELPDGSNSVPDIQEYIEYIMKKIETLPTKPICIYINRINNRLVFKIKDGHKLELQTTETMKLFWQYKKIIDKTKNGENIPSLEVAEEI